MSNLQITGTITKITDVQEGTAKSSGKTWKKLGFVVQTTSEYPKDVFFSVFGEEKLENFLRCQEPWSNWLFTIMPQMPMP